MSSQQRSASMQGGSIPSKEPSTGKMPRDPPDTTGVAGGGGTTMTPHPPGANGGGGGPQRANTISGTSARHHGKQQQQHLSASPSTALDPDFDIYAFLNDDPALMNNNNNNNGVSREINRDPILQQMTVIKYEGDVDQATGFFHGHGRLLSTLGYTYTGQFDRGLMHGQGKIEWSDGVVYEGTFQNNVIEGSGKYTWANGDWYNGQVSSCVRHGKGTFHYKALNATYEGGWDHGRRQGMGTLKYGAGGASGASSAVSIVPPAAAAATTVASAASLENSQNNNGTTMYSGEWLQDKRHGTGVMQYADGGIYEGQWKDDIRDGMGTMKWRKNGVVVEEYTGQWVSGIPSGYGQSTYIRPPPPKPTAAAGSSSANPPPQSPKAGGNNDLNLAALKLKDVHGHTNTALLDGAAPIKDSAVNSYQGDFSNGKRHGFGTFVYDDGSKYEGQWVNNQKHGEGKYTASSGVIYVGQFHEGNPVNSMANLKPETTVSSPLPLYIRDVLGAAETNIPEAITSVQSVVSRNNGTLKKVFQFYSNLDNGVDVITTAPNWRKDRVQGTMSLIQFYRLCSDAKLLNKETTISAIDRMLLNFVDRHQSTTVGTYTSGEEGGGAGSPNAASGSGSFPGATPNEAGATNNGMLSGGTTGAGNDSSTPVGSVNVESIPVPQDAATAAASSQRGGNPTTTSPERQSKKSKHRSSSTKTVKEPYHSPWDKYKKELHTFQGELNFREYVELLVRVAAATYSNSLYGVLAHKLEVLIEEHLVPFTCNPNLASPLFPITRSHKNTVQPFTNMLYRYFMGYTQSTSVGASASSALQQQAAAASSSSTTNRASSKMSNDSPLLGGPNRSLPTMTMRQFSLMLKECGAFDGNQGIISGSSGGAGAGTSVGGEGQQGQQHNGNEGFNMTNVLKLFPYDQHPKISTAVYRKQHQVLGVTHPSGTSAKGESAGGAGLGGTMSSGSPASAAGTTTLGLTHHHSTSDRLGANATPSQVPGSAAQNSVSPMHSERGSTLSLDPPDQTLQFPPGEEAMFRRKVEGTLRSRGFQNNNLHSTLAMELEITYVEFVEKVLAVACSKYSTSLPTQERIQKFMEDYLTPNGSKVGWFAQLQSSNTVLSANDNKKEGVVSESVEVSEHPVRQLSNASAVS